VKIRIENDGLHTDALALLDGALCSRLGITDIFYAKFITTVMADVPADVPS